jgi:hypothetical protein
MNEPLSIPEAVCRAMNTAVEWTLDASTAGGKDDTGRN